MTKTYIAGSSGMIGRAVVAKLKSSGRPVIKLGRTNDSDISMDLSNIDEFDFGQIIEGSRLLMLSAISSPDVCEAEPEAARLINVFNTAKFINTLIEKNVSVLFASSDVVYGANISSPHTENSIMKPRGVYANSKYEIEQLFYGKKGFHSMRLSYVMGPEDKFIAYLQKCYESNAPAEIFDPFSRNIISIYDVVDFVVGFFNEEHSYPPVLNLCGENLVSRLELAKKFSIKKPINIRVVSPDPKFFLVRERIIECKSLYLREILGKPMIDVTQF